MLKATELNQEILKNIQISSQENMIIKSMEKFYESIENGLAFIPIINSESEISIRLIDYFVTKYSKVHKISYKLIENNIETLFNVFSSYKQQLKAYQKKHFDPFSRGDRIPYFFEDSCVITTIGQLNFFRWFISKKILDWVIENRELIEEDMNKKNKADKKKKVPKSKTKILKQSFISNQNCRRPITMLCDSKPVNINSFKTQDKIIVSFSI